MTQSLDDAPGAIVGFYDGLAADYHLVYGDRWDDAVEGQGDALARLIAAAAPAARSVLDCSCGIGSQAIGLATRRCSARCARCTTPSRPADCSS